jgi:hypothetical protein
MPKPDLSVIARFVVSDFLASDAGASVADRQMALAVRIETALKAAVTEEREACAALCDARKDLWQRTEQKGGALKADARARSVEAEYLADAIRVRGE